MGAPDYVDLELQSAEESAQPPRTPAEAPKIYDVGSPSPARSPDDKEGKHEKHDDHGPSGPNWKGDVCQCCGEGVNVKGDMRLCFKALARGAACPCVYYGQNMRRALLLNGYLHCLFFLVGMDLFWLAGAAMRGKCADPSLHPPAPTRPPKFAPGTPMPPPAPPPGAHEVRFENCMNTANANMFYLYISVTCVFMLYAAYRRYQMRRKFGFPSGHWKIAALDVYAWCCCTLCALCQESRTLAYNNVIGGRWLGPEITLAGDGLDLASDMSKALAAQQAEQRGAAAAEEARSASMGSRLHGAQGGVIHGGSGIMGSASQQSMESSSHAGEEAA